MVPPEPQDVGLLDSYSTRSALSLRLSNTEHADNGLTRGITLFQQAN